MSKQKQHGHNKFDYGTYETEHEWITPIGKYNVVHLDCPTEQEIQQRVTDFLNELINGECFDDNCPLCQSMAAQPYNVVYCCTTPCYECDKASCCKNFNPRSKEEEDADVLM